MTRCEREHERASCGDGNSVCELRLASRYCELARRGCRTTCCSHAARRCMCARRASAVKTRRKRRAGRASRSEARTPQSVPCPLVLLQGVRRGAGAAEPPSPQRRFRLSALFRAATPSRRSREEEAREGKNKKRRVVSLQSTEHLATLSRTLGPSLTVPRQPQQPPAPRAGTARA